MTSPLRTGIVALIAIVFSTADSWAAKGAVKVTGARLTLADKKVSVAGRPVASGTAVALGETIVTGRGSHAELTLSDGTVVRIGQGSSFTYAGSKLVLNQGTALVRVAHKNTTVVSGSRSYTGGPAVVSAEASAKTDGLYILQGTGKVNGAPLIAGQTSVLDHGKDRTFTFDLQKLESSSALVKKFPQTPWIVQTEALATVQHQLLAAKITVAPQTGKGAQLVASGGVSSRVASQDIVSSTVAKLVSSGAAGTFTVNRAGNPVGLNGTLQFTGSPVSLGSNLTALIKSAANSPTANGSNLQASAGAIIFSSSGSNTVTFSSPIQAAGLTKLGVGTLALNGGTSNTGGAVVLTGITGISGSSANAAGVLSLNKVNVNGTATTLNAAPLNTGGTLVFTGSGSSANAASILSLNTGNVSGATIALVPINNTGITNLTTTNANTFTTSATNSGTLVLNAGSTFSGLVHSGTILTVNGVQTTVVAGQTWNIGGLNYTATPVIGGGTSPGTLNLQPVTH